MTGDRSDLDLPRPIFWLRISALAVVWAVAWWALQYVPTGDHPHRAAGLFEAAHRALGLFVFSAEGYPTLGPGAGVAPAALWVAHFLAPILTASFLVDAARRVRSVLAGPERVATRAEGHLVLCGFGKHGRLMVRHFLERHPGEEVVVLDNAPSLPPFVPGPWEHPVPVLREDVAADPRGALHRAHIAKAAVLVASTGDDVLNVSLCLTARELRPTGLRLVALVHDDGMTEVLRETLRVRGVEMLDTQDLAAGRLAQRLVDGGLFAEPRCLVIVGFGTFGHALSKVAAGLPTEQVTGMVLVDRRPEAARAAPKGRAAFVAGDALDAETLGYVLRKAETFGGKPLVALCTDDDTANLRVAFGLRRQLPDGVVLLARLFRHPPTDVADLMKASGIQCFELEDLLAERLAEVLA